MYRRNPGILILHISGASIAWLAPDDILSRWGFLVETVAAMGGIFPLLNVVVEKSQFPEVAAVYFALMLAAIPYGLWVGCRMWYAGASEISGFNSITFIEFYLVSIWKDVGGQGGVLVLKDERRERAMEQ